jgi:hypothetical protein
MKDLRAERLGRVAEVGEIVGYLPKAWPSVVGYGIAEIELVLAILADDERARARDIGGLVPFLLIVVVLHQVAAFVPCVSWAQKSIHEYSPDDNADNAKSDVKVNADSPGL